MRAWWMVVVLAVGCSGSKSAGPIEPIRVTGTFCERQPARCEQLCAQCPDPAACQAAGGECANVLEFKDDIDGGPNIFAAGCHTEYPVGQCPLNPTPFFGDWCLDDQFIEEWLIPDCHGVRGDHATYDCDDACKKAKLGGGTCVPVPEVCPPRGSARCKCDKQLPRPDANPPPPPPPDAFNDPT